MKKNSLFIVVLCFIGILSIFSCKNDTALSKALTGKYNARVSEVNLKDLTKASEEVKAELEKGKKELHDNLEKAQTELDKDVNVEIDGKKASLKDLLGEIEPGLNKIMDGFGDLGSGLGKGVTEYLIKNTSFEVDFRDDGVLAIGSDNSNINFSAKKLTWQIEGGKLIIKDNDGKNDNFSFDVEPKNDKELALKNDKISLVLTKIQ